LLKPKDILVEVVASANPTDNRSRKLKDMISLDSTRLQLGFDVWCVDT
jgi:hypothetical protein